MDHFVVYVLCLSCFLVCSLQALWSPAGKALLYVMFYCALSLSHVVCWSGVVLDCIDS